QPPGAEQQHESEMAPTVAPGPEVRRARAPVGAERHRDLGDPQPLQRRFDHHLARELHARRTKAQPLERVLAETAKAAMHVAHGRVKEDPADEGKRWVADPAMRPDHRALLDATCETVAHDEVATFAELV